MSLLPHSAFADETHKGDPDQQNFKEKVKDNVKQGVHNLKVITGNNPYKKARPETPTLSPEDSRKRKDEFQKEVREEWQNRGKKPK
jgi:hypothetical protein